MAESAAAAVYVDQQCELVLTITGGGDPATYYEFEVQDSDDGGTTFYTVPIRYGFDSDGIRVQTAGIYRKTAAAAERWIVRCQPERVVRFRARRVAGTVDTTLLITGTAREAIGSDSVGVPISSVIPSSLSATPCFDDGATPPAALAIAAGPGWTDTDGDEWHESDVALYGAIRMIITAAGGETEIQCRLRERRTGAAVEYQALATNSVVTGVEDMDPHIINLPLVTGNWSVPFPVKPGCEYAVDFRRTGGGPTALADFLFWR